MIALICGSIGFYMGLHYNSAVTNNVVFNYEQDYHDAYERGWTAWFSGYGLSGEGLQYIEYFKYGRRYESTFLSVKDAFFAGYKDGFFFVNNKEYSLPEERVETAYQQYYSH